MVATWDSFFPYVQPFAPGCPEITITAHLQEAAADFCARSEVWRFDIETDYTSKNTSDYDLDVPSGAVLENVLALFIEGSSVKRVSDRHFILPSTSNTARPSHYSIYQDTQLRFYPTPDGKYAFSGTGVLKPSLSAAGVEQFIFETYGRSIAFGAVGMLGIIPGKEWTNPDMAAYYRNKFEHDIAAARSRDTGRVNLRVVPHGFERATPRRST